MSKNKVLFIGLGNAGKAGIEAMAAGVIETEHVLFINTDKKALKQVAAYRTLLIGEKALMKFSSGYVFLGIKAIEESFNDILLIAKQYRQVVIITSLTSVIGGAVAHLAERLLEQDLHVAISAMHPHYFETDKAKAQLVISQIDEIKHRLLFAYIFKVDKNSELVNRRESLTEYLEKYNLKFMAETMSLIRDHAYDPLHLV